MAQDFNLNVDRSLLTADQLAEMLHIKRSAAYNLIKKLNAELNAQGKITLRGRISRTYLRERMYLK